MQNNEPKAPAPDMEPRKLNQYGFTAVEWDEVVEQANELHAAIMEAEDWDEESHHIVQCLIERKQELLAAQRGKPNG